MLLLHMQKTTVQNSKSTQCYKVLSTAGSRAVLPGTEGI